jgi:uncharacterized peroxidase-related enzyme
MPEQAEGRIAMCREEGADERERATFDRARVRFGWVPNTIRVMGRSRSAAQLYLDAGELNGQTSLSALERELLAVATASFNECDYCLTAHSLASLGLGASAGDVADAREGAAGAPRTEALLAFALAVLRDRGAVPDDELEAALAAGLEHDTLLDAIVVVIENSLGNFVNNLAETPVDPAIERAAARLLPGTTMAAGR